MGRLRKWWQLLIVILAVALVIGWEEKRCEAEAYQCRANYTAQERLLGDISVNQQASDQQAIAAACEPNGYFCRLFGPTNLPTVLLVFIGIGGVWAALQTLWAIQEQAESTSKDVIRLNRAYLAIGPWMADIPLPRIINAKFRIYNPSRTAARIEKVECDFLGKCEWNCGRMLTPRESCWFDIPARSLEDGGVEVGEIQTISGRITYTDIFHRERHRKFGVVCRLLANRAIFSDDWTANDEEEWDKDD
jgi:hypothetical protein